MAGTPQGTREQDAPSGTPAAGTPAADVASGTTPPGGAGTEVGLQGRPERRRPGRRLGAQERTALVERLGQRYGEGASIRQIAGEEELSYGFVHRLLTESGTELRGRGGSTRRRVAP